MVCVRCEKPVCEDCLTPFTQFNQCTEDRCLNCEESRQAAAAEYYQRQEKTEKGREEQRKKRNEAARQHYHSPEQVEKRRKASEKILRIREERLNNAMIRIAMMFRKFF